MTDPEWTCPHCCGQGFVLSAADDRIGVCEDCGFAFARQLAQTDGSTWRQQAELFETESKRWPSIRADRYRVIRALASGAQARILLAQHRHLDQVCVIKILDTHTEWHEVATARLRTEARAGVLVNHPNVARVIDCDRADDTWYFVMEYVPGENLRRIAHAVGRLCWSQVVEVVAQVAAGLTAIHAAGLIHRDIKPSNVMLRCDGVPKITDLGLVKAAPVRDDMNLTHDGQILGTPYYMPPEQFRGDTELSVKADIYALGATAYHLLAGKPPYQGSNVTELASRHRHDPVVWSDDVTRITPAWLRHVIEVCLAKRPEHRFNSANALREALRCGNDVVNLLPQASDDHPPRGIMVTAFHNLSRRPEDDWIGDAVAEYLGSRLLEIEGLHVVDRHSLTKLRARQREGGAEDDEPGLHDDQRLAAAAAMLGAGVVIVGSFQRSGDQIRITAHSVGNGSDADLRISANVSGPLDQLFALEDQLAAAIIDAVGSDVSTHDAGSRASGTENLDAHEKFIRGRRAFADGSYASAIKLAEEALACDPEYIDAVSLIGVSYARVGDYDRALEYHQREEMAARRDSDSRRLAEALGNLGVMYYYKGEYTLAHEFLEQAQHLCGQLGQFPDIAKYAGNLGFVLMRLNRYEDAETSFARAIEIHKKYGDLVSLAWPYNGMGSVLLKQRRYAEASEYYQRALGLANEIGDRVNIGVSHMNLGRCACLLGDYAEAEASFDEALQALNGTDFWNGLTLVYEHMADMYLQEGNTESALGCIDRRLELAEKHDNHRMEAEAWEQKAKAYELAGERDKAFQCLKRSIESSQKPAPHESLHRHLSEIGKKQPFA